MSIFWLFGFFLLELWLIFLVSRQVFSLIYTLFYLPLKKLTGKTKAGYFSQNLAILLFLPGIVIHEFSHAVAARLLGVKIGRINFYPHQDQQTSEIKAGSIEIGQTSPLKLAIIGLSPLLTGLLLLNLIILNLFNFSLSSEAISLIPELFLKPKNYLFFLFIFIISTTMFTSRADLKGVFLTIPALLIVFSLLYLSGFKVKLEQNLLAIFNDFFVQLILVLGLTLLIDLLVYIFLFVPVSLLIFFLKQKRN